jgi:A/G-specific adenine glycosylase
MQIQLLESWYKKNHRKLIFRETNNPYYIWVSEVMLQQTQVETVLPFFERFIKKYPTIETVAKSHDDELKKDVEGLGYYRRFKNLKKACQILCESNLCILPNSFEALIKLPGIGQYTAGAIMSIAYKKPYSALDGNVIRVLARYLGIHDDMRQEKNKKKLNNYNQKQIEQAQPHIYTQAMMELGALVCRPKNPKCELCPLQNDCFAYQNQQTNILPFLSKSKPKKEMIYQTFIVENDQYIWLRKRDDSLLSGMYEYVQIEAESAQYALEKLKNSGFEIEIIQSLSTYKHVFTHLIWHMHVYKARLISIDKNCHYIKTKKENLKHMPMAVAHRKIKSV